jgi:hypothetical protein
MGKKKKKNQASRGDLNPFQEPEATDSTPQEKKDGWPLGGATEELDPREIQQFTEVPDYLEPTRSANPIVVKSYGGCYCIDGWELVAKAQAEGKTALFCYVFQTSSNSPTEIALRKVAIRVLPQGGRASYAETVRNVSIAFKMLASSKENPGIYSHGGARRGSDFASNREENIRLVLAQRLEKSPNTISKYLNHAEYLTDEAISALVQARADKEFFEDTQIVKRKLLTNLKSSGTTEDEISTQVSEAMLRMHQDRAEIENYKNTLFYAPEEDKPTEQTPKTPPLATEPERPVTFKHWGGAEESLPEQSVDGDDLRREITAIAQRMISQSQDRNMPLPALKESIMADIGKILSLLQKIGEAEDSPGKEGE